MPSPLPTPLSRLSAPVPLYLPVFTTTLLITFFFYQTFSSIPSDSAPARTLLRSSSSLSANSFSPTADTPASASGCDWGLDAESIACKTLAKQYLRKFAEWHDPGKAPVSSCKIMATGIGWGLGLDPSTNHPQLLVPEGAKVHFLPVGATVLDYADEYDHSWYSTSVPRLMKLMKWPKLHVLKMDCEGCEFSIARDVALEDPLLFERIDNFALEVHATKVWMKTWRHAHYLGLLLAQLDKAGLVMHEYAPGPCWAPDEEVGCSKEMEEAKIDEEYAKSLEKLGKTYQAKKLKKATGGSKDNNDGPVRPLYAAYQTLVSSASTVSSSLTTCTENMFKQVMEPLKDYHRLKQVALKKNVEFGTKYLNELGWAYDELERVKGVYDKAAKEAERARKNLEEAEKNPNSGLMALKNMVSRTDSDERIGKLKQKTKEARRKLAEARNDYILALGSANAHQAIYYGGDLPALIQKMEFNVHKTLKTHFTSSADLYETFLKSFAGSVGELRGSAEGLDADKDRMDFLKTHDSVFADPGKLELELSHGDVEDALEVDEVNKVTLGHRLAKLKSMEEDMSGNLERKMKELTAVRNLEQTYKETPQFGNASNTGEQLTEIENQVDLMQGLHARMLAQITILETAGVVPIKPISISLPSTPTSKSNPTLASKPTSFKAAYAYESKSPNELTVSEGEELKALEDEKGGWIKVKSRTGAEGLVPFEYLKPLVDVAEVRVSNNASSSAGLSRGGSGGGGEEVGEVVALYDYNASDSSEVGFKAGDTIVVIEKGEATEDAWWTGRNVKTGAVGQFPVVFTRGWENVGGVGGGSLAGSRASMAKTASVVGLGSIIGAGSVKTSLRGSMASLGGRGRQGSVTVSKEKARALYDYTATCEGELTLQAGEIINVTNKSTGSADWWEGEGRNGRGQFPVSYVEPIHHDDDRGSVHSAASGGGALGFSVKALYDYQAVADGELSFKVGDYIKVTDSSDKDWWTGVFRGKEGLLPAAYVERV
ncbi:F-BAR and double SH3 domains protein 2 [Chytridiales sp. JEL 0842]|nr:F-BAR and double SH3 domains protein 2 [Chytridiales sp. JEL 0842]